MDLLSVPQGQFSLARHPARAKEPFRAWDAADELLLRHLHDEGIDLSGTVVLLNDDWGALAVALAGHHPHSRGDSYVAHRSTLANLAENGFEPDAVALVPGTEAPPERIDVLLVKVPKALALLEDQLRTVAPHLHAGSVVIGAGMAKHVHTSTLTAFEEAIGDTRTSRAEKKARLIFAELAPDREPPTRRGPNVFPVRSDDEADAPEGWAVTNLPGVFSADRLDRGTAFFLSQLSTADPTEAPVGRDPRIVDLGCGNGVVGMLAAVAEPQAELTFVDESFAAVASAEATFRANLDPERAARFVAGDGLSALRDEPPIGPGSIDRVLCNPPFHVDHALSDAVAWRMFSESHRALRAGGELWVVGNRHLAYHAKLKRLFGNCVVVGSNSRFVVFRAVRT